MDELTRRLERADAEGWANHQLAAPPSIVEEYGMVTERLGSATLIIATRGGIVGLNRVLALGVDAPLTPAYLDEVIGRYTARGVTKMILQLCPQAVDDDMAAALDARGFTVRGRHAKLWRRPDAQLTARTDLEIVVADSSQAELYGTLAATAYGDPIALAEGHAATVGKEGWRHYFAFDGTQAVATAALFVDGPVAWCAFAATLPSHRGRGAHGAMLAARVGDAAAAGCDLVCCETAQETPTRPNPSFRNMRRMGFEVAYYRFNYLQKD
jgi:ribosomal protein S18 acetylase RimI-like enzyme